VKRGRNPAGVRLAPCFALLRIGACEPKICFAVRLLLMRFTSCPEIFQRYSRDIPAISHPNPAQKFVGHNGLKSITIDAKRLNALEPEKRIPADYRRILM
jgi:hypothetical protein